MEYSTATPVASRPQASIVETSIRPEVYGPIEARSSGVSWAAVVAGAFVSAALAVILLSLGTGLGLSSVSPWSGVGGSASAVGAAAIVWLILMQVISCSMGGYLAGRLRTKWASIHNDEVYFRDTAHGFLVWAVGLVITASFLASAAASMMGSSPSAPTLTRAGESALASGTLDRYPNTYFVDRLVRSKPVSTDRDDAFLRSEAGIIFANALRAGYPPRRRPRLFGPSGSSKDRRQ